MNLKADSVQAVLFVAPGANQEDASKLWGHIFPGDTPDGYNRNNSNPALQSTATGVREGYSFSLSAQVGRIDLVLTAASAGGFISAVAPPRLPDVNVAATTAIRFLKQLGAASRPVRLALVVDLADTVGQGTEAVSLQAIAPSVPFPPGATDLLYQVNLARKFESVPNLKMNRLMTLTTGFYQLLSGVAGFRGVPSLTPTPYVGVKIDVNTGQETAVDSDQMLAVADELLAESKLIYDEGIVRLIG